MKKLKFKQYYKKFNTLERNDKVYVERILGILLGVVILAVIIIAVSVHFISASVHKAHGERDKIRSKEEFQAHVQKKEKAIDRADENKQAKTPTDEALLLAHLVTAEVGDLSRESQIAVASVVMNRVESDLFPNTIYDVIYQEGQYECVINGAIEKDLIESATESAYYVYQNGSQIPCNVLWQAEFVQGSGVWAFIDGEYFCYE